jgi:hypothetical protein
LLEFCKGFHQNINLFLRQIVTFGIWSQTEINDSLFCSVNPFLKMLKIHKEFN